MRKISNVVKNLSPGDIFWEGDGGYKCHVLVNLKEENQIVFKYFGRYKKYWHYEVQSYFWFEIRLKEVKDGKTLALRGLMKIKKAKNV